YNRLPSKEVLNISIEKIRGLTEDQYKSLKDRIETIDVSKADNTEWLIQETEKYCQDRAIYNAIMDSIQILDNKKKDIGKGAIPDLLTKALSVSFDTNIGHDFLDNAEARYEFYHKQEVKVPFDIDLLNKITKGGLGKKTFNILMAATGVGKTAFMCHFAASNLTLGKNVLYISMEMSEERIAERIDANLLNMTIDDLQLLPKDSYISKLQKLQEKISGRLIIKEYPTSSAGSSHFRHLLNELKMKKNFIPDVIYIDYLNICSSSRIKMGGSVNSYGYVKAIAEELRALAVEFNVPIVSATQYNRDGYGNSDVDLTNTSESMGITHTADLILALISTEELEDLKQIMVKQLKNRYNDLSMHRRFVVGIDRARMKILDVDSSQQSNIHESGFTKMDDTKQKNDKPKLDFSRLKLN
ncbi:MAG: AAA family ATPase, partial [Cytophagales bacterium]|nr:AAA family ATPase [Cytophagales bacterium]